MGRMELDALYLGYHRPPSSESVAITRTMQIISVISTNLNHVQLQIVFRCVDKNGWQEIGLSQQAISQINPDLGANQPMSEV